MSTASLISHYEDLVSEASILAVFISLITGTAGNAGTQSLAVAVRRLAISDDKDHGFVRLVLAEVLIRRRNRSCYRDDDFSDRGLLET